MPVYEASTHDDLLSISITLGALSSGRASFSTLLLLVASVTPGGGTLASYANLAEVQADIANLNTIAVAMATAAFGQANPPESILIQGVNTGAAQTYVQALDAAIGAGANFYGVLADVRTPATQVAIATDIETKAASETYLLFITQDDDADWKTSGSPSAWTDVDDYERTVVCYHDDNDNDASSARLDVALAAQVLSWDADTQSAPWTTAVLGVPALTAKVTATQKGFLRSNCANTALPFGTTTDYWVDPGQNQNGRPVDHVVSADWMRTRIREALADLMVAVSARGTKITVDGAGQGLIGNAIEGVFQLGLTAGHILDYRLTPLPVTNADITAQRVRFDGEAQFATGVRRVSLSLYLAAEALS